MSIGLDVTTIVLVPSAVTSAITSAVGAKVSGGIGCCTCVESGTEVSTNASEESSESSSNDTSGADRSWSMEVVGDWSGLSNNGGRNPLRLSSGVSC